MGRNRTAIPSQGIVVTFCALALGCGFEFNKSFEQDTATGPGESDTGAAMGSDTGVASDTQADVGTDSATESPTDTGGETTLGETETETVSDTGIIASATLVHRWRFNGDLTDEVGESPATIVTPEGAVGGSATLSEHEITLEGGAFDEAEFVSLGTHLLSNVQGAVSIELFATLLRVSYFTRIFELGSGRYNYLNMTWTRETDSNSDAVIWWGGEDMTPVWATNAPYGIGEEYHILMTIDPAGGDNGDLRIAWYTSPAVFSSIGEEKGSIETSDSLDGLNDVNCWLGKSHSDLDEVANARYNEVRIWDGVISPEDAELLHQLGPDM